MKNSAELESSRILVSLPFHFLCCQLLGPSFRFWGHIIYGISPHPLRLRFHVNSSVSSLRFDGVFGVHVLLLGRPIDDMVCRNTSWPYSSRFSNFLLLLPSFTVLLNHIQNMENYISVSTVSNFLAFFAVPLMR